MSEPVQEFQIEAVKPGPVVVRQADPFMQLVQMAVEKGDLSVVKEMIAIRDQERAAAAKQAFDHAFAAFKAEAVGIVKNVTYSDGPLKGKRYANLFGVVDAVTPALSKHGLSMSWRLTKDEKDWLEVTCTLRHEMGHSETVAMGGPPDKGPARNELGARGSTKTYLERYTAKAILGMAEEDQDNDGGNDTAPKMNGLEVAVKAISEAPDTSALATIFKASMSEAIRVCDADAQRRLTASKDKRKAELTAPGAA